MKIVIEITECLARKAEAFAANENITFRSLIERGLRMVLRADSQRDRFKLRDASVGGRGLQPAYRGAGWPRICEAIYKNRRPC